MQLTNSLKLITENELSQAKLLLEQNGYKVEPPYIQPTDDEICERIKSMNEEVGYVADFSVVDNKYYIYFVDNKYDYGGSQTCKILNTPYTTQSIAKQIVAELNEKRFVYNWTLNQQIENYKNGHKFISDNELRKLITLLKKDELSFLNEVIENALKERCNSTK